MFEPITPIEDTKDQIKFDVVQKAAHYNSHPSGVECKEIVRYLGFDLGNTYKYVFRRDGKDTVRSLRSAIFYLDDWMSNFANKGILDFNCLVVETEVIHLLRKVERAEDSLLAVEFYVYFRALLSKVIENIYLAKTQLPTAIAGSNIFYMDRALSGCYINVRTSLINLIRQYEPTFQETI